MGHFQILIAGGGNGDAIDSFIETVRQFLETSQIKTLGTLRNALQLQLRKFRRNLHSVGDDAQMHLFIAAHVGKTYTAWKTKYSVLSEIKKADMIGFTAHMYRHTVKEFSPDNLPVSQLILLSLYVLDFARHSCTCVDKPYSVVIVNKEGLHVGDEVLIKQFVANIENFGEEVRRLFLSCADTSLLPKDLQQRLTEFSNKALQLHQTQVNRAFRGKVSVPNDTNGAFEDTSMSGSPFNPLRSKLIVS